MTQIPAILLATPRGVTESAPVAEASADVSGSGTFDVVLALAVGQFAMPVVRPIEVLAAFPDGTPVVTGDEDSAADAVAIPTTGATTTPAGTLAQTLGQALATFADAQAPNAEPAPRLAPETASSNGMSAPAPDHDAVADGGKTEIEPRDVRPAARALALDSAAPARPLASGVDAARTALTAPQTLADLEIAARARAVVPVVRMPAAVAHPGDFAATPRPADGASVPRPADGASVPRPADTVAAPPPADAVAAPRPGHTVAASAVLSQALRTAPASPPVEAPVAERVDTTIGAVLRASPASERAAQPAVTHALPAAQRGDEAETLVARVVSSTISSQSADSRAARAGLRSAARGTAIASALIEGVKATTASQSAAHAPSAPRAAAAPADSGARAGKSGTAQTRGAQREATPEPVAPAVTDDRSIARDVSQLATSSAGAARAPEPSTTAAAARNAVVAEEPMLAPRSGDRVTLNLQGENGVEGRLRVAMRGENVHATLVSNDGTTVENWTAGLDQLRRALGERGFVEPRLAIQHSVRAEVTDTHAPERGDQRAPREGQRDPHSGGTSRESQQERHARRHQNPKSDKEPS